MTETSEVVRRFESETAATTSAAEAAVIADAVRWAFRRKELCEVDAQRLLRAANARRDGFGGVTGGCAHGQPSRDDCNSCAMGA